MWCRRTKYRRSLWPFVLLALLSFNNSVYSQNTISKDSDYISSPDKILHLPGYRIFSLSGAIIKVPVTPVPARINFEDKRPVLYDSLRQKASKYLITEKLFDIVIVPDRPAPDRQLTGSSELDFRKFSGKKIRNIEIRRLNIFGSNIDNPDSFSPNKVENLLNKTHLNTNEFIIKKNLLFSTGDIISSLLLSENERILRQLPFIEDARIIVVPASDIEADIIIITKDVYSLGGSFEYSGLKKGSVSLFDRNLLGMGNEFKLEIPYDSDLPDSPGFGINYKIDNIWKTFSNLNLFFYDGLGKKTYGFDIEKKLVSATTRYAGGISIRQMYTTEDLDTLTIPKPLKYNLQDYWLSRSFLINKESVSRIILGARYTNNNVFDHPFILPDSYHYLQRYKIFLGSIAFSKRKYYKTNLIYSYGPTEDIPYGRLFKATIGNEINEYNDRIYAAVDLSAGRYFKSFGYFYTSFGFSSFFNNKNTEQGLLLMRASYFSNLLHLGNYRVRNFVKFDYTRGFDRNTDEMLVFKKDGGFSAFKNDSIGNAQRLTFNLESVLFSPVNFYGFRFAFYAFGDLGFLFGTNEFARNGEFLSSMGLGIRIRNDNLVFNTFQIRLSFFPNLPDWSKVKYFTVSGEKLLNPDSFEPGSPSVIPYR